MIQLLRAFLLHRLHQRLQLYPLFLLRLQTHHQLLLLLLQLLPSLLLLFLLCLQAHHQLLLLLQLTLDSFILRQLGCIDHNLILQHFHSLHVLFLHILHHLLQLCHFLLLLLHLQLHFLLLLHLRLHSLPQFFHRNVQLLHPLLVLIITQFIHPSQFLSLILHTL